MGTGGVFLRRLRARVVDEPTGFVWIEKGKLAGSGFPASRSQLKWLIGQGINSILTLTKDPIPEEWVDGLAVEVGHIPLEDHRAPDLASMDRGAEYISGKLREGKTLVVHCLAGEGRTGCMLAAYMIRWRNMDPWEALKALREIKPEFVEREQEEAVLNYGLSRN